MKITVEIPDHKYNIHIKKGLLADVHNYVDLNRKVLIVTDDMIPEEYVQALQKQCPECYLATVHALFICNLSGTPCWKTALAARIC